MNPGLHLTANSYLISVSEMHGIIALLASAFMLSVPFDIYLSLYIQYSHVTYIVAICLFPVANLFDCVLFGL